MCVFAEAVASGIIQLIVLIADYSRGQIQLSLVTDSELPSKLALAVFKPGDEPNDAVGECRNCAMSIGDVGENINSGEFIMFISPMMKCG